MVSNLGHLPLLAASRTRGRDRRPQIFADQRLNLLNTWSEAEAAKLGLSGVTLSIETDEENLKAWLRRPGPVGRLLYLYGQPALFTTRFPLGGLKENVPLESPRGERFRLRRERETSVVFAERPVFFSPLLKYRSLPGVTAFIIDLEFDPRPLKTARTVHEAVHRGRPLKHASRFNLNRGLF